MLGGRWRRNVVLMLDHVATASMGVVVNSGVSVGLFKDAVSNKGFDKVQAYAPVRVVSAIPACLPASPFPRYQSESESSVCTHVCHGV